MREADWYRKKLVLISFLLTVTFVGSIGLTIYIQATDENASPLWSVRPPAGQKIGPF